MNNQTTERQYVQATIFLAAHDLQMQIMETTSLTHNQKETLYNALDALVEAATQTTNQQDVNPR